ncbi:MAG: MFS transporter [Thermaerobacter sp.]|nr:MFS transporter [Thermaerobacter sp.]
MIGRFQGMELETWQRNLLVLWVGVFVTSASYSMVVPFLPLFLLKIGVHRDIDIWSGVLFSCTFLASALISPYWGSLADRYGRRPMILRSGFALFVAYALTAIVQTPMQLLILRTAQGLLSGYVPNAITLVGTSAPQKRVGWALSIMATGSATGSIVGPLLGGGLSHLFGTRIAFASASVLVLLAAVLALLFVREDNFAPARERTGVGNDLRVAFGNRPFLGVIALTLIVNFSIMTIEPILPLYIVQLGGSLQDASLIAGIVFSLVGIASVFFAPRWGRLADRRGFLPILTIGLLGGGLGNLLQIPFHTLVPFAVVRFAYGAFFCAVFPALNGLVVQTTPQDFRGRAFGLNQSAGQMGTMLGPLVGGLAAGAFGIHTVFWLTGGCLLIAAMLALRGARHWGMQVAAVQGAAD